MNDFSIQSRCWCALCREPITDVAIRRRPEYFLDYEVAVQHHGARATVMKNGMDDPRRDTVFFQDAADARAVEIAQMSAEAKEALPYER